MIYKVQSGQTIFDIAIKTYGAIEYVYKLIEDNDFIESIDYDFDVNPNAEIYWDETYATPVAPELVLSDQATASNLQSITATNGQSLYDLCLMAYGDLTLMYKFLQENNISLNSNNINGKMFIFNTDLVSDKGFYNYLRNKSKVINTLDGTFSGKAYNKSFNISFH